MAPVNRDLLIEVALAILGFGAIAWIAIDNRKLWAQHDAAFGSGDNTDVFRAMYSEGGSTPGDGCGWAIDDGGDCGVGGDGGGCD